MYFYSNDSNVELGDFHGNYESTHPHMIGILHWMIYMSQ